MKQIGDIWLPDSDTHLEQFRSIRESGEYQLGTLHSALSYVRDFRLGLDIGAHCGLWCMHLLKYFYKVIAFEPVPEHLSCLARNAGAANVQVVPCALGAVNGKVRIRVEGENTGHTHVDDAGELEVEMIALDTLALEEVGFIKIDVEGYEYHVLRGGRKTIRKNRPVICLEQKAHGFYGLSPTAGVALLQSWGYRVLAQVRDDYIMGWGKP